jgi:RNA polymerase sigma-32 factor
MSSKRQRRSDVRSLAGALGGYRIDSERSRPLPRAELHRLFSEYRRTRAPALARKLAEANMRLVLSIAIESDPSGGRLLPDLVQEGNLGLLEAVRRFDPDRGAAFATYAGFWIRAAIVKFMRDNVRLVRVGRSRADRAAYHRGELPAAELSLETPVNDDDARQPLRARLAADAPRVDDVIAAAEVAARSAALCSAWSEREQAILQNRLLAEEPTPLRRLARRFSLSGERMRQIEAELVTKLRLDLGDADRSLPAAA